MGKVPASEAAQRGAQPDPQGDHRDPAHARRPQCAPQPLGNRLLQYTLVGAAQLLAQAAIALHALGVVRMRGEPGRHDGPALLGQLAVGVGLEVELADLVDGTAHLTTLSFAGAGCPSIIVRSFSRARDSRDITVPIGMPSVRATWS